MKRVLSTLNVLKLWQIGVLVSALAVAIGATYGTYAVISGSGSSSLGENQQLISVQYGDLINQVSTNGNLILPNRETLSFSIQGTVGEVLVEEGQEVEAGQPLVSLNNATLVSLNTEVAQERINLKDAEDALDLSRNPHTALDIAQAETEVANARLSLKKAQDGLDVVMNWTVEEDLVLNKALHNLSEAEEQWGSQIEEAQDTLSSAREAYHDIFSYWLGITLKDGETDLAPDILLDSWDAALTSLFSSDSRYEGITRGWFVGPFPEGSPADDPSTSWNEDIVYLWMNLSPVDILPTCEDQEVPSGSRCIKKEFNDAWDTYQQAKDDLDAVNVQAAIEIADAEEAVKEAEAKFDPLEVDLKEKELVLAQETLLEAEEEMAKIFGSVDPLELALLEAELVSAKATLDEALERLEKTILKATMDGVVSLVNVEVGQEVNPTTPVVEIVDPTVVEVDGIVDEIDVLFVREGARAEIIMDALQGQILEGTVSEIASVAQSQQGIVSYPIRIQVDVPEGMELPEGLSATAIIVIREETDVLLVPNQVLFGSFQQPIVQVMNNGSIEERAVILGNSDGFWTVVLEGLQEGDQVVMETAQASTDPFAAFRQLRGGGFGGGGFGGGGGGGFGGGRSDDQ